MAARYLTTSNFKTSLPSWTTGSTFPTWMTNEVTTCYKSTGNSVSLPNDYLFYYVYGSNNKTISFNTAITKKTGMTFFIMSTGGSVSIAATSTNKVKTGAGTIYQSTFTLCSYDCLVTMIWDGSYWWAHPWYPR